MATTLGIKPDDIIEYIRDFIDYNRVPPTPQEIGQRFGMSANNAAYHLHRLHEQGRLKYRPKAASKALRITLN